MAETHKIFDLIVVGSGPAGLAGALFASERGKRVLLLEKENRFGGKIPLSGGGRCNVTNVLSPEEIARAFGKNERFLLPALRNFPPGEVRRYFQSRGVEIEVTDGFHCFPRSKKAADLVKALLDHCDENGVTRLTNAAVDKLLIEEDTVKGVHAGEKFFYAPNVLLACGGKSYPKWSGSELGYSLARQGGHTVTSLYPAMTGVKCTEMWTGECAGISLEDVKCSIDLPKEKLCCRGELLFTHEGISAFAVLDLAGRVAELLTQHETVPLKLDLFAHISPEEWRKIFQSWRQERGKNSAGKLLSEYLPKRLIPHLCPAPETPFARFSGADTKRLLENLTSLTLHAHGVENWHKAMVTRGGVELKEINSKTMESRLIRGLYFAGELTDLDGPCGGYNIQWALSSGALCGTSIS